MDAPRDSSDRFRVSMALVHRSRSLRSSSRQRLISLRALLASSARLARSISESGSAGNPFSLAVVLAFSFLCLTSLSWNLTSPRAVSACLSSSDALATAAKSTPGLRVPSKDRSKFTTTRSNMTSGRRKREEGMVSGDWTSGCCRASALARAR